MTNQIGLGSWIYISLGGAVAHSAVCVSGVCGRISNETEKAVELTAQLEDGSNSTLKCWFPKRALVKVEGDPKYGRSCKLAHWFKPNGWTLRFLELAAVHGGQSAA